MAKIYTGIGARKAPPEILQLMTDLAASLKRQGWTLRSGAADGADTAFEDGAGELKEIYLPWKGFNGSNSPLHAVSNEALSMAESVHGAWDYLKPGGKKLHGRNCYQLLGSDLSLPSRFVICWTPDGATKESDCSRVTGGTGTAIKLASRNTIPVFNLKNPEHVKRIKKMISREMEGAAFSGGIERQFG